ncbi:transferase family-domain-containing protein [Coniochaeta sp. 2T2.1]|nr:transferase family-domain-containing protein [Coniochaeta sp. 2T2.1]
MSEVEAEPRFENRIIAEPRTVICHQDSTVKFVVQHLDSPEDAFPSLDKIADSHFVATALGDINLLSNAPMTYGEKPEANPDANPFVASYKANFIPGGLIFNMHSHHYSNDVMGWGSFTKQLAENCHAIIHKTAYPSWDPKCLDRSRFTAPALPDEAKVDAPPQADRHPDHKVSQSLIFHLPKSKATALKKHASPTDGSSWISTYDAVAALAWRIFSRIREPVYRPDRASKPVWAEGVNLRKRLRDPPVSARTQGNVFFAALSAMSAVPALTAGDVVDGLPLSGVAAYVRRMTDSVTGEMLGGALAMVAPVRNKKDLSVRVNSFPLLSMVVTDWRDADVCGADFGFGRPVAFRHLFDTVTEGPVIVYPPRAGPAGEDEGVELQVTFEKELVPQLVEDPEWSRFFEFRGVDAEEAHA